MYLGLALPSLAQEGAARVSLRCERHGPIGAVSPDRAVFSIIRPPPSCGGQRVAGGELAARAAGDEDGAGRGGDRLQAVGAERPRRGVTARQSTKRPGAEKSNPSQFLALTLAKSSTNGLKPGSGLRFTKGGLVWRFML